MTLFGPKTISIVCRLSLLYPLQASPVCCFTEKILFLQNFLVSLSKSATQLAGNILQHMDLSTQVESTPDGDVCTKKDSFKFQKRQTHAVLSPLPGGQWRSNIIATRLAPNYSQV